MKSAIVRVGLVPHGFELTSKLHDDDNELYDEALSCHDFGGDVDPYLLSMYLFYKLKPILENEAKLKKELEKFADKISEGT